MILAAWFDGLRRVWRAPTLAGGVFVLTLAAAPYPQEILVNAVQ